VRRLGLIAVLLLPGCVFPLPEARAPGAPVAITFAQQNADFTSTANTLNVTLPGPSVPGDALVVGTMWKPASATPPVLSDSQNDAFKVLVPGTVGNDTVGVSELSFAALPSPGLGAISLNLSGSGLTYLELACVEYSGIDPGTPLDVAAQSLSNTSSLTPSAELATTVSGDLLVGWAVSLKHVDQGPGFRPRAVANGDLFEDADAPDAGSWRVTAVGNDPNWLLVAAALKAQRK
jgi:hypothetical protein